MTEFTPFQRTEKRSGDLVIDAREARRVDPSGCETGIDFVPPADPHDEPSIADRIEQALADPIVDGCLWALGLLIVVIFTPLVWS